jgi:hypothetical protein
MEQAMTPPKGYRLTKEEYGLSRIHEVLILRAFFKQVDSRLSEFMKNTNMTFARKTAKRGKKRC